MALRVLQVIVPRDKSTEIFNALDDGGWNYYYVSGIDNTVIMITADAKGMESVIEQLKSLGVGREYGVFYLTSPISALPKPAKEIGLTLERASRDEIMSVIERAGRLSGNYIMLVILSAILAAFGLLANNVAVIIGSMVVAPLMGPITSTAIGTVLSDRRIFEDGVKAELVGIVLAILVGFLLAKIFPGATLTTEILARAQPTIAEFVLAIISGLAAAVCLTGGIEAALVGVAIAASLMPPATNVGIGLGMGNHAISLGSAFLLLVNIFSINLACTLMFWVQGIRPVVTRRRIVAARVLRRRVVTVVLALLVLSIPISLTTQGIYEQARITPAATLAAYSQAWSTGSIVAYININYDRTNKVAVMQLTLYSDKDVNSDFASTVSSITMLTTGIPTLTFVNVIKVSSISFLLG